MHALIHNWWKWIPNGDGSVEKQYSVTENLVFQVVLLCFLCLLLYPWNK